MYTLNCRGKIIKIDSPMTMGIINVTPDSFYKGYAGSPLTGIVALAGEMINQGAAILDIGAQSTRPGSIRITAEEETARLLPVINAIKNAFPEIIISVDTYNASVAAAALEAGASIINDVSAGEMDPEMIPTVASWRVPYICMHMKGTPETMQQQPHYNDVVKEVLDFFILKVAKCRAAGINDIIIDPGFGFGKTVAHNFTLLKNLSMFSILEVPVLAGLSRKSTIYKTLGCSANEALNGTTVLNTIAMLNGANIIRVHDVKEAAEAATLVEAYKKAASY